MKLHEKRKRERVVYINPPCPVCPSFLSCERRGRCWEKMSGSCHVGGVNVKAVVEVCFASSTKVGMVVGVGGEMPVVVCLPKTYAGK